MDVLSYSGWSPSDTDLGFVIALSDDGAGWDELRDYYLPVTLGLRRREQPGALAFDRVLEVARMGQARSAFVEWRYIDIDFRSEHSFFYSTTFRRYPSVCHRIHFFTEPLTDDLDNLEEIADSYLGYSVIRPLPTSPIGRTVLAPPPRLTSAILCSVDDQVHLKGVQLTARGVPFVSQDGQYLRCSHSCLWSASYHAHLRRRSPRHLPRDVREAALGGEVVGRQTPHEGLSVAQLLSALHDLGFSGGRVPLPHSKTASAQSKTASLPSTFARYANSGIPTIVFNQSHSWLVVGYYFSDPAQPGHDSTCLIIHDDVQGPYLESLDRNDYLDPWSVIKDEPRRWRAAVPALPSKVYITAERAEWLGRERLTFVSEKLNSGETANCCTRIPTGQLRFRTYVTTGAQFKEGVVGRLPEELASFYRTIHLPKYVWVVEAIDESLAIRNEPCVVGEALVDATAHHLAGPDSPALLARNVGGNAKATSLDHRETLEVIVDAMHPYESGLPGPVCPHLT